MERKVKVILTGYVERFGKPGDIVEVNSTFAGNFIFPKKLGRAVSDKEVEEIRAREKKKAATLGQAVEQRSQIREKLHGKKIVFKMAGEHGHAFGGVSAEDVAKKIAQDFGVHVDKTHVRLPEGHHLKKAGVHEALVHLHADTFIRLEAEIVLVAK